MSSPASSSARLVALARDLKAITGQDVGVTIEEAEKMSAPDLADKIREFGSWWKHHCEDLVHQVDSAIYAVLDEEEN